MCINGWTFIITLNFSRAHYLHNIYNGLLKAGYVGKNKKKYIIKYQTNKQNLHPYDMQKQKKN